MEKTVRSFNGALLQTAQKLGLPYTPPVNSTLNQKFGVFPDVTNANVSEMAVRYLCIGIGGHTSEVGVNNRRKNNPIPHQPSHAALYDHIPFVLRPVSNDLSAGDRLKYRMRVITTIAGVQYAAYYLRVLPVNNVPAGGELRTQENGITTSTPWTYPLTALSPTPPMIVSGQTMVTGADSLVATSILQLSIGTEETAEIMNAVSTMYGDEGYAIIGEMGLCAGVDRVLPGDFNGTSVSYTEAVSVVITDFLSVYFPAAFMAEGVSWTIDAGAVEPLLTISAANAVTP